MKIKKIVSLLLLFSFVSLAPLRGDVLVISDIDDTIKVSDHRGDYLTQIRNFVKGKPYPYLIAIYQEIKKYYESRNEKVKFFYLSASPQIFPLSSWLKLQKAPLGKIQQRRVSDLLTLSLEDYKISALRHYLQEATTSSPEPLKIFMFGDNGQYDPQVYQTIRNDPEFQSADFRIFIREVYSGGDRISEFFYFPSEKALLDQDPFSFILSKELKRTINLSSHFIGGTIFFGNLK